MRKMAKKKNKNKKSVSRRIVSAVTTVLLVLIVAIAVLLAGVRIFGFTPYAVLSGSMTPVYRIGDLVYVKETDFEDIEIGDVITFVADSNLTVVTHRVTEIDEDNLSFTTKGDANSSEDASPVAYENVLGVVKFSIPKLGYVSNYISTKSGKYVAAAVLVFLILLMILPDLFSKEDGEAKDSSDRPRIKPQKPAKSTSVSVTEEDLVDVPDKE